MARGKCERDLIRKYREKAEFIADSLRFRKAVEEEELATYLPGGEKNPGSDADAWIFAYASMVRFCDRLEDDQSPSESDASTLDDALLDSPETVTLSAGESISVYPKSFTALRLIERCDRHIHWFAQKRETLLGLVSLGAAGADDLEFIDRLAVEMEHQYRVIAWIAIHPAPGLPFEDDDFPISVPENIRELSPTGYMLLRGGFLRVNALRLALLVKMLSAQSGSDPNERDTWATFFANQEVEGHGPAKHLMRDRSLVSQLAAALAVGESRRRAEEARKSKEGVA